MHQLSLSANTHGFIQLQHTNAPLLGLPEEIWGHIFSYLNNPKDLKSLAKSHRVLNTIVAEDRTQLLNSVLCIKSAIKLHANNPIPFNKLKIKNELSYTEHDFEAFYYSCKVGCSDLVEWFLSIKQVNPAANNNEPIRWAAKNGYATVVKILLKDPRVDPAANDNAVIQGAAFYGHADVVAMLLKDTRVDPAANDNAAIRWAAKMGHKKVVELLLKDTRVNPTANDNEALRRADDSGHEEIVAMLLKDTRVNPTAEKNAEIQWTEQARLAKRRRLDT